MGHHHHDGECCAHEHTHVHHHTEGEACLHKHNHHHGHHHHHGHGHHHHHHAGEGNIFVVFLLNLFFCIIEFVGGFLTGSIAILSDALHDLGDALALGLAWRLEKLSERGRDMNFSYGYKRFSLLGALMLSIILLVGSFFMIKEAIIRLWEPGEPHPQGMMLLAVIGLLINGVAVWRMGGSKALTDRSIRLHLMEDVLGWIAVLLVSIVMHFVYLPILDPLLSLGISGWILYNVYFNLRDTLRILLQGIPEDVSTEAFTKEVNAIEGVVSLHDLHVWTLNGSDHIASVHIVYCPKLHSTPEALASLKECIRVIASEHRLRHITLELDPEGSSCGLECC